MNMSHIRLVVVVVLGAMFLSACATSEIVPVSGPRAAMPVEQVKFYQHPPKRYEILGPVTVSREEGATWDERGDATAGFDILRKKAAALGANGLLLQTDKGDDYKKVLAGYHGEYYQVPVSGSGTSSPKALARAIYVIDEE